MISPEGSSVLMTEEHIELAFDNTVDTKITTHTRRIHELNFHSNHPDKLPPDFLVDVSSPDSSTRQNTISIDPVEKSSTEDDDLLLNSEHYELVLCVPNENESVGGPMFTLMAKLGEIQGNLRVIHFEGSASISTPSFKQIAFVIQFTDLEKPKTPLSINLLDYNAVNPSNPVAIKQTDHAAVTANLAGGGSGLTAGVGMSAGRDTERATTEDIKFKGVYSGVGRKEISYTWKAPPMLTLDGECRFQVGIPKTVKKGVLASFRVRCELDKAGLLQPKLHLPKDTKKPRNWHSLKLQLT